MATIPGTIPVTSGIAPTDTTDTYATHIDNYGQGGYMTVTDTAARNAITEDRRKLGMAVCTTTDNKIYTLTTNPAGATTVDGDWTEFSGGGSSNLQDVFDEGTDASSPLIPPYSTSDVFAALPDGRVIGLIVGDPVTPPLNYATVSLGDFGGTVNQIILDAQSTLGGSDAHSLIRLSSLNTTGYSSIILNSGEIEFNIAASAAGVGKVLTCSSTNGTAGEVEWTTPTFSGNAKNTVVVTGATATLDLSLGNLQVLDLSTPAPAGAVTLTLSTPSTATSYTIRIHQGLNLNTLVWPGTVKWEGATPLTTPTQVNGATDMVSMIWDGTNYWASYGTNFGP